ncbi:atp-binding cassette g family transporter abcg96, partial [Cystoisospora suis]
MDFSFIKDRSERKKVKKEYTDTALEVLGLKQLADNRVGNESIRGISGGEKRRLTLGLGLMSDAQVLLCDEPTTGLSASDACGVIRTLRRMCLQHSLTVIAVIHQPSIEVLEMFDSLVLLSCQGECAYNGRVKDCRAYFERMGYVFPLHRNPADFLSDLLSPEKGDPHRLVALYKENVRPLVEERAAVSLRKTKREEENDLRRKKKEEEIDEREGETGVCDNFNKTTA